MADKAANAAKSMFQRAKKLDLGCFVQIGTIRDHTKRKAFEAFETERCVSSRKGLHYGTAQQSLDADSPPPNSTPEEG